MNRILSVTILLLLSISWLMGCVPATKETAESPTWIPTVVETSIPPTVESTPVPDVEIADELCTDANTGTEMGYEKALAIATASECLQESTLLETHACNAETGTWWIDLGMDLENCSPACVVDLNTGTAEINYRCTGALPDQEVETLSHATAWYGRLVDPIADSSSAATLILLPEGTGTVSLSSDDKVVKVAIQDYINTERALHFWGPLTCDEDTGACTLLADRVQVPGPQAAMDPDIVEGWEGVIYSGPPGPRSGGDDYLVLLGDWNIQYGIDGAMDENGDRVLVGELEQLRDTGTVVRVWGKLIAGIPDWNGTQIQVEVIEEMESASVPVPAPMVWPDADDGMEIYVNEDYNYKLSIPPGAELQERGPDSFPTDELPDGMTSDQYMEQLWDTYGGGLCIYVKYGLGYLTISAPQNQGFRYAHCGRTGVGAGEIVSKDENLLVGSETLTAQG